MSLALDHGIARSSVYIIFIYDNILLRMVLPTTIVRIATSAASGERLEVLKEKCRSPLLPSPANIMT